MHFIFVHWTIPQRLNVRFWCRLNYFTSIFQYILFRTYNVIFTARIRRMVEGNIFSQFTLWGGGTPSQVWGGGYPISGLGGIPGTPLGLGIPLIWDGVPPTLGWGTPRPGMGYPQTWDGVTPQTWDGVPPRPEMGNPKTWDGVPPRPGMGSPQTWDGVPPRPEMGYPPTRQISIVSTCYAAGGMPLAFTQEDFLVPNTFRSHWKNNFANLIAYFLKYFLMLELFKEKQWKMLPFLVLFSHFIWSFPLKGDTWIKTLVQLKV